MNRRIFVVGLGTVATISGVASVTAASFADSVTAGADFRVVVDENLTLQLGDGVPEEGDLASQESWNEESLNFSDVTFDADDDGQLAYINDIDEDPTNEEIDIELAIANDEDITDQDGYDEFLAVRNDGVSTQSVGIEYVYDEDVDTTGLDDDYIDGTEGDGPVDPEEVNQLFEFTLDDTPISPDDTEVTDARFEDVDGGENEQIDLNIDLVEAGIADTLADEADVEDNIFSSEDGVQEDFNLLAEIRVGVEDT